MTEFNDIQRIKRHFFALRNGIIADTLRKAGSPFKIIFGLNLPQIKEVAAEIGTNRELAETLWANVTTRESMLLAPMIFPSDELDEPTAMRWIATVNAPEIADGLCHQLLRKTPLSATLIDRLADSENDMERYIALRLAWNRLTTEEDKIFDLATKEFQRDCRLTKNVARQLLDEIEFIRG